MLSTMVASTNNCCQLCKDSHATQRCPLSASEKQSIVLMNKLCLNCLRFGHRVSNCNARGRCANFNRKHHTAIHGIQIHRNANHTSRHSDASPIFSFSHAINVITTNNFQLRCRFPASDSRQSFREDGVTALVSRLLWLVVSRRVVLHKFSNVNNNTHETMFLKSTKAVALSIKKKLTDRIFFHEGSQRSYFRTAFASSVFWRLSDCKTYGVTKIGLETPTRVEYVLLLVTDEIVQP